MDFLDDTVTLLTSRKDEWATLPVATKLDLLQSLRPRIEACAQHWVNLAAAAKKIPADSPWVGEEWVTGPWALLMGVQTLAVTLEALAQGKRPPIPAIYERDNGQVVAKVFPTSMFDRLLLSGISAEIWMEPAVSLENIDQHIATFYKQATPTGKVALVLGAGNINAIPVLDVLHKLYHEGQVVVLKMNPVNDYLTPVFKDIFLPFIDAGYVQIVKGDIDTGQYLVEHPMVDEIHITGSVDSFNAIVFGTGPEGEARRQRNEPVLQKRITSELGGVAAAIVLPGPWDEHDIRYQAENLVTMKFHNSGFNCAATQVLVLPEEWDQHDVLLNEIRQLMRDLPPRDPYYPGCPDRMQNIFNHYDQAEHYNERTLITGIPPEDGQYCFRREAFSPILFQTSLPGATPAEFLQNAVNLANNHLTGTLGITLIVHPVVEKALGDIFTDAIDKLHYGSVGINIWDAGSFLLPQCAWGSYPGQQLNEIQSGIGFVHNSFMLDRPQKTVVRGSFYPFPRSWLHGDFHVAPRPPWFVTNPTAHITTRRIAQFAAAPGWKHLPGIVVSGMRGI